MNNVVVAAVDRLYQRRADEEAAFHAAVAALKAAYDAKLKRIYAEEYLWEAQGLKIGSNPDLPYLNARRYSKCKHIIERALTVTLWDRLGLS